MRRLILAAVLVAAFSLSERSALAQWGVMKYAILVAVDADDSNDVSGLRNTIGGVLSRLSGRDPDPLEPEYFDRFVLTGTDPEIDVRFYLGYETGVSARIAAVIDDIPQQIMIQSEYPTPITRTEMLRRLRARARNDGYTRVWEVRRGIRSDGLILQKFNAIGSN